MFSNAAARKGIHLSHTVEGLPKGLKGDPARLRQILANLVGNAVKFTREGSVVITAKPAPYDQEKTTSGAVPHPFSVRDTGIGIPEDQADTIFQEFTQLETSLSRPYGGTGLGLAICKKLVDLMGEPYGWSVVNLVGVSFIFQSVWNQPGRRTFPCLCRSGPGKKATNPPRPQKMEFILNPAASWWQKTLKLIRM